MGSSNTQSSSAKGAGGGSGGGTWGRERAIETLMDMDPRGSQFRATRIMDEAVPSAQLSRPNRISLPALIEVAHSLGSVSLGGKSREIGAAEFFSEFAAVRFVGKCASSLTSSSTTVAGNADDGDAGDGRPSPQEEQEVVAAEKEGSGGEKREGDTPAATPARRNLFDAEGGGGNAKDSDGDDGSSSAELRSRVLRHHAKVVLAKEAGGSGASLSSVTSATAAAAAMRAKEISSASPPGVTPSSGTSATAAAAAAAAPPAQLVAALRRIFCSSSSRDGEGGSVVGVGPAGKDFASSPQLLPSLLRSALSHPVFGGGGLSSPGDGGSEENSCQHGASGGAVPALVSSSSTSSSSTGNLEALVGNAVRSATEGGGDGKSVDDEEVLQGLLLAALSVLTGCLQRGQEESLIAGTTSGEQQPRPSSSSAASSSGGGSGSGRRPVDPAEKMGASSSAGVVAPAGSATLQVGGILSLLDPFRDGDGDVDKGGVAEDCSGFLPSAAFACDGELLEYLSSAAAAYESRIEAQKGRLLTRLRKERERERRRTEKKKKRKAAMSSLVPSAPSSTEQEQGAETLAEASSESEEVTSPLPPLESFASRGATGVDGGASAVAPLTPLTPSPGIVLSHAASVIPEEEGNPSPTPASASAGPASAASSGRATPRDDGSRDGGENDVSGVAAAALGGAAEEGSRGDYDGRRSSSSSSAPSSSSSSASSSEGNDDDSDTTVEYEDRDASTERFRHGAAEEGDGDDLAAAARRALFDAAADLAAGLDDDDDDEAEIHGGNEDDESSEEDIHVGRSHLHDDEGHDVDLDEENEEEEDDDEDDDDEDEDEDDEDEDDDEEAAMLRRALALSLAEHNAALAATEDEDDEGVGDGGSNDGNGDGEGDDGDRSGNEATSSEGQEGSIPFRFTFGGAYTEGDSSAAADADAETFSVQERHGAVDELSARRTSESIPDCEAIHPPLRPREDSDLESEVEEEEEEDEDNDDNLPALPPVPPRLLKQVHAEGTSLPPHLDPADLARFGSVPASVVLNALLQQAAKCASGPAQKSDSGAELDSQNEGQSNVPTALCFGGVGASLFPPPMVSTTEIGANASTEKSTPAPVKKNKETSPCIDGASRVSSANNDALSSESLTLHLLIALLRLCSDLRSESIRALRRSLTDQARRERDMIREGEEHPRRGRSGDIVAVSEAFLEEKDDPAGTMQSQQSRDGVDRLSPTGSGAHTAPIASGVGEGGRMGERVTSSESFESKGMRRKAAAAARESALLRESLRRTADARRTEVEMRSACCFWVLKCLMGFVARKTNGIIEERERATLEGGAAVEGSSLIVGGESSATTALSLPPESASRLAAVLDSFVGTRVRENFDALLVSARRTSSSHRSGTVGCEGMSFLLAKALIPGALTRASIDTWALCLPTVLYPDMPREWERSLRDLLKDAGKEGATEGSKSRLRIFNDLGNEEGSACSLAMLPWSGEREKGYRLEALCRRLRCADSLDLLLPAPMFYMSHPVSDEQDSGKGEGYNISVGDAGSKGGSADILVQRKGSGNSSDSTLERPIKRFRHSPARPAALLALLHPLASEFASSTKRKDEHELLRLYLALCHRFQTTLLLWDGARRGFIDDFAVDIDSGIGVAGSSPAAGADCASAGTHLRLYPPSSGSNAIDMEFDSTRCADSIAILSSGTASANGPSALQRASKVWGTVLSTRPYSPKTGVHRWAVRLDRCERGHVFVGVATASAGVKTYVGGDRHGWGVIGTQALWHDRGKVRGEYGGTFRTGAVVVVTLDTDAGTVGFGLWRDASSVSVSGSGAGSTDNITPSGGAVNLAVSPFRRSGFFPSTPNTPGALTGGGVLEDWGVAFEGLPLDARLYPAVGLYQRDDRVTLVAVSDSTGAGRSGFSPVVGEGMLGGEGYYPIPRPLSSAGIVSGPSIQMEEEAKIYRVREWNATLSEEVIQYATNILIMSIQTMSAPMQDEVDSSFMLFHSLLPSVAAGLCLVPSNIPSLSARIAASLLPFITECAVLLDRRINRDAESTRGQNEVSKKGQDDKESHGQMRPLMSPCSLLQSGRWIIRATPSSSSFSGNGGVDSCEEYVVDLSDQGISSGLASAFRGSGKGTSGRSAGGRVSIAGMVRGTSMQFAEEWDDGGGGGGPSSAVASSGTPSLAQSSSSSSCVIDARLSLDGCRFEGSYRNVQYGTTGFIAGTACTDGNSSDATGEELTSVYIRTLNILCHAIGHLTATLCGSAALEDAKRLSTLSPSSLSATKEVTEMDESERVVVDLFSNSIILSAGATDPGGELTRSVAANVREMLFAKFPPDGKVGSDPGLWEIMNKWKREVLGPFLGSTGMPSIGSPRGIEISDDVDVAHAARTGGVGSLSVLDPVSYGVARRSVVSALLYHCGLDPRRSSQLEEAAIDACWRAGLGITEACVRFALAAAASAGRSTSRKEACRNRCAVITNVSAMLLSLRPACSAPDAVPPIDDILHDAEEIFASLSSAEDIKRAHEVMKSQTCAGVLRCMGLGSMLHALSCGISTSSALEELILPMPRLLGPGPGFCRGTKTSSGNGASNTEIGGHYLSLLSGCASAVQYRVRNNVHNILRIAVNILFSSNRDGDDARRWCHNDSLQLAVLSGFFASLRSSDIESLFSDGIFIRGLANLLRQCRDLAVVPFPEAGGPIASGSISLPPKEEFNTEPLEDKMIASSNRLASAQVLRVGAALMHIIVAQVAQQTVGLIDHSDGLSSVVDTGIISSLLDLLRVELAAAVSDLSIRVSSERSRWSVQMAEADWNRFQIDCDVNKSSEALDGISNVGDSTPQKDRKGSSATGASSGTTMGPGIQFLLEHGAGPSSFLFRSSGSSGGSSSGAAAVDILSAPPPGPTSLYLRQLLNVMYSAVRSTSFVETIASDSNWVTSLITWADEDFFEGVKSGAAKVKKEIVLPFPIRVRILRLLGQILPHAPVDSSIVRGLLLLVGRGFSVDGGRNGSFAGREEGGFIFARETVSLLRQLCFSSSSWRELVAKEINLSSVANNSVKQQFHEYIERGRRAYFSGIPGRIFPGSYVLLKPAAAAALSDLSSSASSSGKSHSSSSGSSGASVGAGPVAVGTGAEGVVAGLCRDEAMSGMVSSVDTVAGTCEVVLFDRRTGYQSSHSSPSTPGTAGMTVRALRANLSDVVSSEEWPFTLSGMDLSSDQCVGKALLRAVRVLSAAAGAAGALKLNNEGLSVGKDGGVEGGDASEVDFGKESMSDSVFALRSGIALLSDKSTLDEYLTSSLAGECLPGILGLAAIPLSCLSTSLGAFSATGVGVVNEALSSIPDAESKFWHIRGMLRHVLERRVALEAIPVEHWDVSQEGQTSADCTACDSSSVEVSGSQSFGYVTPPTSAGSGTGAALAGEIQGSGDDGSGRQGQHQASGGEASASTAATNRTEEEEEEESAGAVDEAARQAEETAAAHLREAAIVQMAELGLPRSWSEYALRRVGGTNIEAAVHFCLERGSDMERLLADESERERRMMNSGSGGIRRRGVSGSSGAGVGSANHLIRQLIEMGFPSHWCAEALAATGNNVDEALTWILTNGERLSAQDQDAEEDIDDEDDEEDDEEDSINEEDAVPEAGNGAVEARVSAGGDDVGGDDAVPVVGPPANDGADHDASNIKSEKSNESSSAADLPCWPRSLICPLRFVSGRSSVDPTTLTVSGLPTGGFSSVGTKGVPLLSGKWYYEAHLITAGCLQIGWADASFAGHCQADRGDGCGDGPSSWAYDGWRRYRWHGTATEWGCRWQEGDTVGCLVDLDEHVISFTLNGRGEDIGMGVAFEGSGFRPCGGVYACVSFNRREKIRMVLGGEGTELFKYPPPPGYRGVGEAIREAAKERDLLLKEEEELVSVSAELNTDPSPKHYLCDFSDGEHGHELFAWQHRYYGSDASVHLGSSSRSGGGGNRSGSKRTRRGAHRSSGGGHPSGAVPIDNSSAIGIFVMRRLANAWKETHKRGNNTEEKPEASSELAGKSVIAGIRAALADMLFGYKKVEEDLWSELGAICLSLGILYSRKLVLHIILTMSSRFRLSSFVCKNDEAAAARNLWSVMEACASLAQAGWVGEAGAMAIAAEALGLGISSHDHHSGVGSGGVGITQPGVTEYESCGDSVALATGGMSQVLSFLLIPDDASKNSRASQVSLAVCAEAALGGEAGGAVSFLRNGLQAAASTSPFLQKVFLAAVRRSVRLLAVVEYGKDDSTGSSNSDEREGEGSMDLEAEASTSEADLPGDKSEEVFYVGMISAPDARLALFLTGLLLTAPVQRAGISDLAHNLFEAWSVGLLSASAPWRMVCALTVGNILNLHPKSLSYATERIPTLNRLFARLASTVARRVWAERAAVPVCSRYVQAYIDLLCAVRRARGVSATDLLCNVAVDAATPLPISLKTRDANNDIRSPYLPSWEWCEGWVASHAVWEVLTGSVELMTVDWLVPSRSAVRTLMDGGEGPPMLREGCFVMRGLDWGAPGSGSTTGHEDGKDLYEKEKAARDKERRKSDVGDTESKLSGTETDDSDVKKELHEVEGESDAASDLSSRRDTGDKYQKKQDESSASNSKKKKKKKLSNPKLPIGTVISIEPWNGLPGLGRRVRWNLTGAEGVYRYGGDGGRYDIVHVEVNDKATKVRKRHPLPESVEQCVARYGFGVSRRYNVILRLMRLFSSSPAGKTENEQLVQGILEWPDFGAGILVDCQFHSDGAVTITERELLFGSKDSGWQARFGQPSYVAGTVMVLSPTSGSSTSHNGIVFDDKSSVLSHYEELLGSNSYCPPLLRDRADGQKLLLTSEMRLLRGRRPCMESELVSPEDTSCVDTKTSQIVSFYLPGAPLPPPICFDSEYHASSISLSRDGRTATCVTSDGRGTAFASVGFSKGVHYWEVKIEQADIGSVFIGVAEKSSSSSSGGGSSAFGYDSQPRLNRWHGWGFVNFRATYTAGAERVYGAHCHAGDTVGVLLDCDTGRISFFFDGVKYGEHIVNDLGCAFENISPFGFNADGCGGGGAGQGAPSGIEGGRGGRYPANGTVQPKALWPVVGLRNPGDRVTMSGKWLSGLGVDGASTLRNAVATDEILAMYDGSTKRDDGVVAGNSNLNVAADARLRIPKWFVKECYHEYERWRSGRWLRSVSRGSGPHSLASFGLDVDIDTTPLACASACASLGLGFALLSGDRVAVKRSAGRLLELTEEAIVLGACQGRLFYRIVLQKSEGGSLTEGGGRAWFWDESEVVGNSLQVVGVGLGLGIELPLLDRFRCNSPGGLRIIYAGGAVVRSDLEIFDGSANIGTIPHGTVIAQKDVLERRVNSCGVVRYRIRYESVGEGWISSRIRGGKEEAIVDPVPSSETVSDERASESKSSGSMLVSGASSEQPRFTSAEDAARFWLIRYTKALQGQSHLVVPKAHSKELYSREDSEWSVDGPEEFEKLLFSGIIPTMTVLESDSFLAATVGAIADFSPDGNAIECSFADIASAITFAVNSHDKHHGNDVDIIAPEGVVGANQAAAANLAALSVDIPSAKALVVRIAMLRSLNRRARFALPWLSVRPAQEDSAVLGGLCGFGASMGRAGRSRNAAGMREWVQAPSVATRLRSCRSVLFTHVKKFFIEAMVNCTTTPTPLSHDEYELPREVRTVRVNRLKARRAMASNDPALKRKHSVFSQLQHEMRSWSGAALRRGHVAKGHGGQKRAFKVKLVGEGVNDYSGPYREVFTDAMKEVTELNENGFGALGVLEPSPNNVASIGDNQSLFIFSHGDRTSKFGSTVSKREKFTEEEDMIRNWFSSFTTERHESVREAEESIFFLGRLSGTACRHGIPVDLPLPLRMVWSRIAESDIDVVKTLDEMDSLAFRQYIKESPASKRQSHPMIDRQQMMLNSFADGLAGVLPMEIFSLMTGRELQDIMCGHPDIDVDLLRRVVEYEGYNDNDQVIVNFWDVLREMTIRDRKLFLQFVWARSRLPVRLSDLDTTFTIQRDTKCVDDGDGSALPSASTCFFSLTLPAYQSKELLKKKLLFAIKNVTTMESDYVTNDAEVGEGWRGL